MRKFLIGAFAMLMSIGANAQYQLANSDFEEWESVTYNKKTGEEPVNWNSFLDGTGGLKSTAGAAQVFKETENVHGGSACAKLTARNVLLGIIAQGNLTTGCINMGSMTATDAKGNYNYINEEREDQAMKFSGRPDAVKVWVDFTGSVAANVEVVLTTKGYYQSPEANNITATKVAHAQNASIPSNGTWTEYTIPFTYDDENAIPYYALVNISTSGAPGKGSKNDVMYVDDIVMVYNSELETVSYDGVQLSVASSMTVDAQYDESKLVLTSNGKGATIEKSYDAATAVLTVTVKGDNISEDASNLHTYIIQFKNVLPMYTVKFMDGETELKSFADVEEGTATPKPETEPTKEGYTFDGWDPEVAANVTADATYTAKWKINQYKVTFVANGATVKEETLDFGAAITAPEAPAKEGYTFKTWGEVAATVPAENVTYTADYSVNQYKVTFVADGQIVSEKTLDFGSSITTPSAPSKEGYSFISWGEVASTVPAEDVTYTADFRINKYTVTFIADGAKVKEETLEFGSAITVPEAPSKEGYTFKTWGDVASTVPAKDVTYTAEYTTNQFKVTFVIDGTTVKEETLDFGASITAPAAPAKEGYTFAGWTEAPATMPAEDVTVTGSYTINKYTVKFVDEDGTVYSSESVDFGSAITVPAAPTKEGFEFTGWTPEVDATVPANDVTYTATWKEVIVDAIAGISVEAGATYYTTNGVRLSAPRKGVNIVKFANGQVKKVYVK